jgi:hypothetical protein
MRASEVMVPDPHVAVAGAMASEVAIMLKTRNISVVPVVDDHRTRKFLGTLSDRDLVTRCLAEGKHPWHTRADSLMRTNSPVVAPCHWCAGSSPTSRWNTRPGAPRLGGSRCLPGELVPTGERPRSWLPPVTK